MKFEILTIEHKKIFDERLTDELSADRIFSNLFLWRFDRKTEVALYDETLLIRLTYKDGTQKMLFPVSKGSVEKALIRLVEMQKPLVFRALNETQADQLKSILPDRFAITHTPEHDDYLYDCVEMIELKGRAFHSKKNFVNRFVTHNNPTYERINDENQQPLIGFVNEWFANAPYQNEAERLGIVSLIENYKEFDCKIGMLLVAGKIVAFTVSEQISKTCVVVHIEKADASYAGSYQAINQIHLQNEWQGIETINREEDLGIEGLRKAKLSYHPTGFVKKFQAALIG